MTSPGVINWLRIAFIAMIWGGAFMVVRMALRDFQPLTLAAGRITEIDALQGRIIEMGRAKSIPTPLNSAMHAAVKMAEQGGKTGMTPDQLRSVKNRP